LGRQKGREEGRGKREEGYLSLEEARRKGRGWVT